MIFSPRAGAWAAAGRPMIESANGDWSNIPMMPSTTQLMLGTSAMQGIDRAVAQGKCPQLGNKRHIRLQLPVLVKYEAQDVRRVVVAKIGCPEVEEIVGNATWQSAVAGRFRPTGVNQPGWYRSEISYQSDD